MEVEQPQQQNMQQSMGVPALQGGQGGEERQIFDIDVAICQNGIICPCSDVRLPVRYSDPERDLPGFSRDPVVQQMNA